VNSEESAPGEAIAFGGRLRKAAGQSGWVTVACLNERFGGTSLLQSHFSFSLDTHRFTKHLSVDLKEWNLSLLF